MRVTEVRVECQKMVSDGNYGNERYAVVFTLVPDEQEVYQDALEWAEGCLDQGHDLLLERLKRSRSEGIREALETREEREARWDRERDEARQARDDHPFPTASGGGPGDPGQ